MSTVGGTLGFNSVLNTANWTISYNGVNISGGIAAVVSDGTAASIYNPNTGKYNVSVFFGNQVAGVQGLSDEGTYVLTISQNVRDAFGNALDGNLDGTPGGSYSLTFNIVHNGSSTPPPPVPPPPGPPQPAGTPGAYTTDTPINLSSQTSNAFPAVATDAAGDYVVVWASTQGIVAQRFSKYGVAQGGQLIVNSYSGGLATQPNVAMDAYGDFVVTWWGNGSQDANGVYARIFDSAGNPVADQFLVNQYTLNDYNEQPKVAMDPNGDFVISWTGYVQGAFNNQQEIYYRRYSFSGTAQSGQTLATVTTGTTELNSNVAMDAAGDFVIAWQEADGSDFGIHAQKFVAANGFAGNGEFIANTVTADKQIFPSVAMDAAGDFVIAWQDFGHDGSGYGVYARRFNAAGVAQGAETLVNQTTINWQISPEVSMDAATGDYAVSWTTFGEPAASTVYSVYARTFSASGAATSSEFRVNANTLINSGYMDITALTSASNSGFPANLNPAAPDIAMDAYGNFVVVWGEWSSGANMNIYQRKMVVNSTPFNLAAQSANASSNNSSTSASNTSSSKGSTTTTTTTSPPTTTTPPTTTPPTTTPPTTTPPTATTTTNTKPPATTPKPPTTTTTAAPKPPTAPTTTTPKPPTTTTTTTTTKPPTTTPTTTTAPPTTTTAPPTTTTKPTTPTTPTAPKPPTSSSTTAKTSTPPKPPTTTVVRAAVVASTSTASSTTSAATSSVAHSAVDQVLRSLVV